MSNRFVTVLCLIVLLLVTDLTRATEAETEGPYFPCSTNLFSYGGVCLASCGNTQYFANHDDKRCYLKNVEKPVAPAQLMCDAAIPSMFFSWVIYEHKPAEFIRKTFSAQQRGYERLQACGNDPWTIVNAFHTVNDGISAHVQIVQSSPKHGTLLVVYRGTELDFLNRFSETWMQWAADADLHKIKYPFARPANCGKIHHGFYRTFMASQGQVAAQIEPYLKAGWNVIFTGHSLGAAVATDAIMYFGAADSNLSKYISQMRLITFGSPKVGNSDFVTCFNYHIGKSRVQHYIARYDSDTQDLVSVVPPKLFNFQHVDGTVRYVQCESKNIGNPSPIAGIGFGGPKFVPKSIGCHYQQVYMDGLLDGKVQTQADRMAFEFESMMDSIRFSFKESQKVAFG